MLEQLRKKLEALIAKLEAMNDLAVDERGEVRAFSDEEKTRYESIEKDAEQVRESITRHEKLEQHRKDSARLLEPAGRAPNLVVTREDKHDENGLPRIYREIGRGGFGEFLRDVARMAQGYGESQNLKELRAATGANESVGSEGGFLVQPDHAEKLFSHVVDAGSVASRCTRIPMASNATTITLLDETSLANGSIFGGVQAYWRAEAGQVTATKPKFRQVNVKAEALEALFYATEEQLEDAPQLEAFANLAFSTAMADKLDEAIIDGSGAGVPLGILRSPSLIEIAKESGQTASTIVYLNLDKMYARLLVGSENSAVWVVHPDAPQQIRNIVYTPGSKTDFMPLLAIAGLAGSPDALKPYGLPLVKNQNCKAVGTKGDVILSDFSKYFLFERRGIVASQSMHVAFLTSERVFKWNLRANGMPVLNSPITDKNGTTTRSPFLATATRS